MRTHYNTIGSLAAALITATATAGTTTTTTPAPVQPSPAVEYDLHVGYTTEYLWRGLDLGQDLAEAGFNVKTQYSGIGLSAGAWYGSYDTTADLEPLGKVREYDIDELDLYAEASKDFGFLTAAVGYIYYNNEETYSKNTAAFGLPGGKFLDDAQEAYFSVSRDFGFFKSSLTYFWDIETDNDGYSELALSRTFALNSSLTLNIGSNVGYLVEQGQATAWTTKVGLDWAFVEKAKLSPFVALSIALSDDADTAYEGSTNELVAGSMLSVTF